MNYFKVLTIVFSNIFLTSAYHNNVCKSFSDYYTNLDQNKNCYYNPDSELSTSEIIKRHGYPVEIHKVTTDDGYILTIFRIPYSKKGSAKGIIKQPVLLQHGININSECFVNLGPNSLGFYLSDAGYDVWLGNFRGNKYSLQHQILNSTDDKFWDFSFHEHGLYDLSAQIDLVKKVTEQKIICIGYSMGNTAAFVYGSLRPKLASKNIKYFIALAPAVFVGNFWFHLYAKPAYRIIKFIKNPKVIKSILKTPCFSYPFQAELCATLQMFVEGFNHEQLVPETLPITLRTDVTSPKLLCHYFQMMESGKFEQFDYGSKENVIKYGSSYPPEYNLSNISFPVQLIVAPNDQVATVKNAKKLYQVLPRRATRNSTIYIIKDKNFNHSSLISGKDTKRLVFDIILRFLSHII